MSTNVFKKETWGRTTRDYFELADGTIQIFRTGHVPPIEWGGIWRCVIQGVEIADRVSLELILENTLPRLTGDHYKDDIDMIIGLLLADWDEQRADPREDDK